MFGAGSLLVWEAVLSIAEYLEAPLASTYYMPLVATKCLQTLMDVFQRAKLPLEEKHLLQRLLT